VSDRPYINFAHRPNLSLVEGGIRDAASSKFSLRHESFKSPQTYFPSKDTSCRIVLAARKCCDIEELGLVVEGPTTPRLGSAEVLSFPFQLLNGTCFSSADAPSVKNGVLELFLSCRYEFGYRRPWAEASLAAGKGGHCGDPAQNPG
jgi:hypothetical protein